MKIKKFIESLGPPDTDNVYELRPDKEGTWWLEHVEVGSGEPLEQALRDTKVSKAENVAVVLARVITFPFFIGIAFMASVIMFSKFLYNFLIYGGEAITYTRKNERKMINDVYYKVKKLVNVKDPGKPGISSFGKKLL